MTAKPPSGPRYVRLPEPLYHPDESAMVRKAAGSSSVSSFIREAVLRAAKKTLEAKKK